MAINLGINILDTLTRRKRKAETEALDRAETIRQNVQSATAKLADLLKAGTVDKPTTIPAAELVGGGPEIPATRIGTTFGGEDIGVDIPGLPAPTGDVTVNRPVPVRGTPEFQNALTDLAAALGGKTLLEQAQGPSESELFGKIPIATTTSASRKAFLKDFRETGKPNFGLLKSTPKEVKKTFKKFFSPITGKGQFEDISIPGRQDELIAAGFNTEKPVTPTVSNIKGKALLKFTEEEKLTPQEQKIVDKELQGRESPADVKAKAKARWEAKISAFETAIGRDATIAEKRKLFINDPFSILGPAEGEGVVRVDEPLRNELNQVIKDRGIEDQKALKDFLIKERNMSEEDATAIAKEF